MKRGLIILVLLLFGSQLLFVSAAEVSLDEVPTSLRNNQYFTESLRLNNLARLAYAGGEYDASIQYSQEAIRYALLSDEYVRLRLKMRECDIAIAAAGKRLEYAASINATTRFPAEYSRAQAAYEEARSFRAAERWDDAIAAANRVLALLAYIDGQSGIATGTGTGAETGTGTGFLPSQYTVRSWEAFRDCLWNIAGRPWVYDDPFQWRRLYEANRSRMPDPGNPDLIEPGMVLDIPSIRGEVRQGMWDSGRVYSPLP